MTNYEKYKDDMIKVALAGSVGLNKYSGLFCDCRDLSCEKCFFDCSSYIGCKNRTLIWLDQYVEPDEEKPNKEDPKEEKPKKTATYRLAFNVDAPDFFASRVEFDNFDDAVSLMNDIINYYPYSSKIGVMKTVEAEDDD